MTERPRVPDRPVLTDATGNRLELGAHVTYLNSDVVYIVTRLDPPASLVYISLAGGREHETIPALLRRVGAPVSIGEEVSDGRDRFVVLAVSDDLLFCDPVFGGPVRELARGSVYRVAERGTLPSTVLDLGEVLSRFGRSPATTDGLRDGRVLPMRRRRTDGAA